MKRYGIGFAIGLLGWVAAHAAVVNPCMPPMATHVPLSNMPTLLAKAQGNSQESRLASAQVLGWLNRPETLCEGYFADPYIPGTSPVLPSLQSAPVTVTAGNGVVRYEGVSTLGGPVVVSQPGRLITAHNVALTSHAGIFERAKLTGAVFLRESGKVVVGKSAIMNLQNKTYRMEDTIYRMFLGVDKNNPTAHAPLSAWGNAASVTQPSSGIVRLRHVSYSTCPPQSRAWTLQAGRLDLNHNDGRGHAYDAVLYTHGVPIFYAPYFDFPIDNRRQTGFLYPQLNFGSTSGFGFGLPFYWNIAPNKDDTITPYFYTKRGFALSNLYRYLTPTSNGTLNVTVLPNDWAFRRFQQSEPETFPVNTPGMADLINANSTRSFISLQHDTQFTPRWNAAINYTRVSDDYYVQDLGGVPVVAQNQLLQQAQIHYSGDTWRFLGNLQGFQTLHPVNEAVVLNQYSMLPQLLFTSHLPLHPNALNYQWQAEIVHFIETPNPGQVNAPPGGERFHVVPGVILPLSNTAGYITPRVQWDLTQYELGDQPSGFPQQITRAVPIFDIDSGIFLLRNTTWFDKDYEQTLEPRLFYLFVPYRDQHDIPVFDSALQPFSYDQLFATNRFIGSDRIGDANQISAALTTRIIDQATGVQKFSASVGIIRYFENRNVTLCSGVGCIDSPYSVGSTSTTDPISPIVGKMQYNFTPHWNGSINAAWDPNNAQAQNALFNVQYMPAVNHIVNVGYNYIRYGDFYTLPVDENSRVLSNTMVLSTLPPSKKFNLSQPTVSFAWPLTDRWQLLGSWSYSWNQNHALTYFAGAAYNSCCWALQMVVARSFNGFNPDGQPQFNTGVYVQWAFKGLANVAANDPTTLLLTGIPGYQNNFGAV